MSTHTPQRITPHAPSTTHRSSTASAPPDLPQSRTDLLASSHDHPLGQPQVRTHTNTHPPPRTPSPLPDRRPGRTRRRTLASPLALCSHASQALGVPQPPALTRGASAPSPSRRAPHTHGTARAAWPPRPWSFRGSGAGRVGPRGGRQRVACAPANVRDQPRWGGLAKGATGDKRRGRAGTNGLMGSDSGERRGARGVERRGCRGNTRQWRRTDQAPQDQRAAWLRRGGESGGASGPEGLSLGVC